jgi:uncharacterized protein (TIGR02246 family)
MKIFALLSAYKRRLSASCATIARDRRSMQGLILATTVALISAVATARAAEPPQPDQSQQSTAVQAVAAALVDDWNRHDMKRFAGLFTEDAQFVNVIGLWWRSRAEIQEQHEALHATRMRNSHLVETETAVHFLRPDVAVVHIRWELTGDTGMDGVTLPMRRGVMSLVMVRAERTWHIASAQNTDVIPLPNLPQAK